MRRTQFKVDSFLVTNLHQSAVRWFSHIDELKEQRKRNLRRKVRLRRLYFTIRSCRWQCQHDKPVFTTHHAATVAFGSVLHGMMPTPVAFVGDISTVTLR